MSSDNVNGQASVSVDVPDSNIDMGANTLHNGVTTGEIKIDVEVENDGTGDSLHSGNSVEFSQEKDAPEVAVRVYDFDMVKEKTLPRSRVKTLSSCSSRAIMALGAVGVGLMTVTVVLVLYFVVIDE